jgi:peroxiredoxin
MLSKLKPILLPLFIVCLLLAIYLSVHQRSQVPEVTFTTIEGKKISLSSLRGKMVLVNFWATDCPGCIKEMPKLVKTYEKYRNQGLEIIAVAMPDDPPTEVVNYTRKNNIPFPVMDDGDGAITNAFGEIRLTPTTIIISPDGKMLGKTIGEIDFSQLETLLNKSLVNTFDKAS